MPTWTSTSSPSSRCARSGACGLPIAVGGGVVLAGVLRGEAPGIRVTSRAVSLAQLQHWDRVVNFREYQRLGDQVIDVLRDFTLVERSRSTKRFLDVAASTHLFGPPPPTSRKRLCSGATRSGYRFRWVSRARSIWQNCAAAAKPDGLIVALAGGEQEFLRPPPVELICRVPARAAEARLASAACARSVTWPRRRTLPATPARHRSRRQTQRACQQHRPGPDRVGDSHRVVGRCAGGTRFARCDARVGAHHLGISRRPSRRPVARRRLRRPCNDHRAAGDSPTFDR